MALTTTWCWVDVERVKCALWLFCLIFYAFFFYHSKAEQNRNNHANSDRKKALRWQSVKVMVGSVFILVSADLYAATLRNRECPFV